MRKRIAELEGGVTSPACASLFACAVAMESLSQKGRQQDFRSKVLTKHGAVDAIYLTDTGASAQGFVDGAFVRKAHLPQMALTKPCRLRLADDKFAPNITHMAKLRHALGDHMEEIWCLVTKLGRFDIILGMPWLEQHKPSLALGERTMTLHSDHCMANCLLHSEPITIRTITPPIDSSQLGRKGVPSSSTTKEVDIAKVLRTPL